MLPEVGAISLHVVYTTQPEQAGADTKKEAAMVVNLKLDRRHNFWTLVVVCCLWISTWEIQVFLSLATARP